jgi:D-hexose-6-phosphate mutarotase
METLDGLIQAQKITPADAMKVLHNFDVAVAEALANDVKTTLKAKGYLHTYNHVDDVLNLSVSGKITLHHDRYDVEELQVKNMRIVAMRAHDAQTPSQIAGA